MSFPTAVWSAMEVDGDHVEEHPEKVAERLGKIPHVSRAMPSSSIRTGSFLTPAAPVFSAPSADPAPPPTVSYPSPAPVALVNSTNRAVSSCQDNGYGANYSGQVTYITRIINGVQQAPFVESNSCAVTAVPDPAPVVTIRDEWVWNACTEEMFIARRIPGDSDMVLYRYTSVNGVEDAGVIINYSCIHAFSIGS